MAESANSPAGRNGRLRGDSRRLLALFSGLRRPDAAVDTLWWRAS